MDYFFKLKRALNLKFVSKLNDLGIGTKQAAVLICATKYGPISSAKLAGLTLSDPAAISRSVDVLIKHGLIKKMGPSADRRVCNLILTKSGKLAADKIIQIERSIAEEFFGILSSREQKQLISLLDRIVEKASGNNIKKERNNDR